MLGDEYTEVKKSAGESTATPYQPVLPMLKLRHYRPMGRVFRTLLHFSQP